MKKITIASILSFVVTNLFAIQQIYAQCPMCKGAAEANLKEGGTAALGLNTGILYLLFTPYALVLLLGFLWWRNNKKVEKAELSLLDLRSKAEAELRNKQ